MLQLVVDIKLVLKEHIRSLTLGYYLKYLLVLACTLLLIGCDNKCYDPDSFNGQTIEVSVYGSKTQIDPVNNAIIGNWRDTNRVTDGNPILITISDDTSSRWGAIYQSQGKLSSVITSDTEGKYRCKLVPPYIDRTLTTLLINEDNVSSTSGENIGCYFDKGIGLYVLFMNSNLKLDPNQTAMIAKNPIKFGGVVRHLGNWKAFAPDNYNDIVSTINTYFGNSEIFNSSIYNLPSLYSGLGGVYIQSPESLGINSGAKIYLKFLDYNYADNAGGYKVWMRSGVKSITQQEGLMSGLIATVRSSILKPAINIFNNIVSSDFAVSIKALLVIYITSFGILYLMGVIQINQGELFIRILKLMIVIGLLSEDSLKFFNEYLFGVFLNASTDVISIIFGGSTEVSNKFSVIDSIFGKLFTNEIWIKIVALLFVKASDSASIWEFYMDIPGILIGVILGSLLIIIIIYVLFKFMFALVKACIMYMLSLVFIGLSIAISPIFISFILFQNTTYLTQNWFRQLAVYTFQPILVFAGLAFLYMLLWGYLERILGYKVCPANYYNNSKIVMSLVKPKISNTIQEILVPYEFQQNGSTCKPYQCKERRYIDIPFYRPAQCVLNSTETDHDKLDSGCIRPATLNKTTYNDQGKINDIMKGVKSNAYYVPFSLLELFTLAVLSYMIMNLMDLLPTLGAGIAGQQFSFAMSSGSLWDLSGHMIDNAKMLAQKGDELLSTANPKWAAMSRQVRDNWHKYAELGFITDRIHILGDPLKLAKDMNDKVRANVGIYDKLYTKATDNAVFRTYDNIVNRAERGAINRALKGDKLMSEYNLAKIMKDHYLSKVTLGTFGESAFGKQENLGRENRLSAATTRYSLAHDMTAQQDRELYNHIEERISGLSLPDKYAIGGTVLAALNPIFGAIPLIKYGYDAYKANQIGTFKPKDSGSINRSNSMGPPSDNN